MTEATLTFCFFIFVMAAIGAALLAFRWRTLRRPIVLPEDPSLHGGGRIKDGFRQSMLFISQLGPQQKKKSRNLREKLAAAGYRGEIVLMVFQGGQTAAAIGGAIICGWIGLLSRESLDVAILTAICGAGFCYMLPDRILEMLGSQRRDRIDEALPPALDLIVLGIEAGQPLDAAMADTARQLRGLFPELCGEFQQAQLELRAGRARGEILHDLGARTESEELRRFTRVLLDAERFGANLGPALRNHSRHLRTRRRQTAQESARKLGVKLVFPVFFLIMPSVFVVTLGPAMIQLIEQLKPMIEGM
jgi:tight adherence protein C